MKNADPEVVIILCESTLEHSEGTIQCSRKDCIDHLSKLPRSIAQLHKCFPKGKPKRGGDAIFTNCLVLHNEDIGDMILDVKDSL